VIKDNRKLQPRLLTSFYLKKKETSENSLSTHKKDGPKKKKKIDIGRVKASVLTSGGKRH